MFVLAILLLVVDSVFFILGVYCLSEIADTLKEIRKAVNETQDSCGRKD